MHSSINSLPLDSLVQILCKLNHNELKHSLLVSKSFRNAALAARQQHFDFSTPAATKKIKFPFSGVSIDGSPQTPVMKFEGKKPQRKLKLSEEEARKIAVVLFPAGECKRGLIHKPRWSEGRMGSMVYVSSANF